MSLRALEKRLDKIESKIHRSVHLAWAEPGDNMGALHDRLAAENPLAEILILHWMNHDDPGAHVPR